MSAVNEINEPPDKSDNNDNSNSNLNDKNDTDATHKQKNSRPRSPEEDNTNNSEFKNNEKRPKTMLEKIQTDAAKTLLRNSLLNRNPFAILDSDVDTEDLAGKISKNININQFGGRNNNSAQNQLKQRVPPIVITKPFVQPNDAITNISKMLKGKVMFKILKQGYNVTLESLEDHNTLAKQRLPTFTTLDKKPLRLVLKGVHHTYTPAAITEDLSTQNVKVISVQPMYGKGKVNMDMFIVNFEQGTKINELTKSIKYICHQSISWHQFIKKEVGTQCRKCQRFGHAATNCGLEYRCVKCTERHAPGDCPLENDQPAKCVNCKDAHPASYKKCPVYIKYAENLKKPQNKKGKNSTNTNDAKKTNFSSSMVNSNVSYSQVLKANAETRGKDTNLNFMSNEINSLFDCSLTELMQKIQSFVPEYKKVNDLMMKKIMIIDFLSQFT